ncbi:MAG: hypothetical protein KDB14_15255, partial [Planctomycetales bacterium]|nr:hypothetical protein [Planctomycetales bacterium]
MRHCYPLRLLSTPVGLALLLAAGLLCGARAESQETQKSPQLQKSPQSLEPPHWIWVDDKAADAPRAVLSATLEAPGSVRSARIVGGADFCHLSIQINGVAAADVDAYADWFDLDVTEHFREGANRIVLSATRVEGPAAVAARVTVQLADGRILSRDTDGDWMSESGGVRSLGRVLRRMWLPERPASIRPTDDYTQWKRALGGDVDVAFEVADGYRIERLLRATASQSSWVSMGVSADPAHVAKQGLLIGREDEGFLRVRFAGEGVSIEPVVCDQALKEPRGIAATADGSWVVNANNSKAVYTLQDDGRRLTALKRVDFPGGAGHGRNDLLWTLTPSVELRNGRFLQRDSAPTVYSIHGDSVDLLRGSAVSNRTSPWRDASQGRRTSEGHLLRLRFDSIPPIAPIALVSAGLRNPFGVAMNLDGERFTYDADAEYDMGAPWYRPTRIVHLTDGADYGWRGVTKQWPPYFPDHADNALPLCDVGKGSPTAVGFAYAADFPKADREALYVLDWAYGRVLRVHMTPRGAGYRARCETFLRGRPLNVTDIAFVGGDMLLITGGRKTQSDLYRIRHTGAESNAPADAGGGGDGGDGGELAVKETEQQQRRLAFGQRQRQLRRQLERLHQRPAAASETEQVRSIQSEIWPALADADPQVRYAARIALEWQRVSSWREAALAESHDVTAVTALTALSATSDAPLSRIAQRLNQVDWRGLPPAEQVRLLACDNLCLDAAAKTKQPIAADALEGMRDRWLGMYRAAAERRSILPTGIGRSVAQQTLRLLIEQGAAEATSLAMRELTSAAEQDEELYYLYVLRLARQGWNAELRR